MALPAPPERYEKFRRMLIEARQGAGLTQVELAEKLDRPHSFVWKVENGRRGVDVIEFLEIMKAIGSDPFAFLRSLSK